MSRHRAAAAPRVDPRQRTLPNIPTLTDVVSGPDQHNASAATPARPRRTSIQTDHLQRLEEYVFTRLKERLDREIDALVERRLMPELANLMAHSIGQGADELKSHLRELVRDTVQEALARTERGASAKTDDER
ncbi:MAG: hypothetical protein ABI794_12000 [Betaproteobacteria bacterium]